MDLCQTWHARPVRPPPSTDIIECLPKKMTPQAARGGQGHFLTELKAMKQEDNELSIFTFAGKCLKASIDTKIE